ncbi:DUF2793 domain-containing protein [uncultured Brevundimonas sp.]|uniref:DUF2793 domain-containing protein n=1 Tax=uncultured Brevundimonas sp. TaxID=213418 RepID=UPI0025D5A026|nr:DUF2793 domain-containing protein [uncultured Brevundimonas sp.]
MSDDFSARLNLPYVAAGQMQKHVTLNTALTRLDALLQTAVVSRTTAIQPDDASDGDLYILPPEAEGAAWAGRAAGTLMRFEAGGWTVVSAPDGTIAGVLDEGVVVVRADGAWIALGQRLGEVQGLKRLGLGTTADEANPLAAKINAALFTARGEEEGGDGDLRLTLNKATAGDVLSLLFQSGYAARAELGLIGDDDLRLKACDDAGIWRSVWRVDRATGRIAFDQGAVRRETTLFTSDDDYALPAWACWVEATCVGGGGGGGEGLTGPSGAPRLGGGGGGAGGLSLARWSADDLEGVLSVKVGAGGIGGVSGGDSEVATGDMVLLRATGGAAGGSGVGGAGGIGQRLANSGGSSSTSATAATGAETLCSHGPGGGGAGGGLSAADVAYAGGAGGVGGWSGLRAAGGVAGAAGQASPKPLLSIVGGGGGGGDASASGAGGPGGAGAHFGAGGGGGGAGLTFGGQGGSGASGAVLITVVG